MALDELASFREKLTSLGCKFGIFIALRGVVQGFRDEMKTYLRSGVVIALLTEVELRRLEKKASPTEILQDAYYATITHLGEGGQR